MLSYNQLEYLPQAINSVLSQKDVELELIVLDPGSTDGSRAFLQSIALADKRVRLIFEKDLGPADGLRKGLALAKNEIIGCLNSDDFYLENVLQKVNTRFREMQDATVIYSHGYILKDGVMRFQACDKFSRTRFITGCSLVFHQGTFYRNVHLKESHTSFNPENKTCWDAEILLDIALKGRQIGRVHDAWGVFRLHPASISGSGRSENVYLRERDALVERAMGRPLASWEAPVFRLVGLVFAIYRRGLNHLLKGRYPL